MIDHLLGRPSTKLKRVQVFFVILFWSWVLKSTDRDGPRRIPLFRWLNGNTKRFTPWQIIVGVLTLMYGVKHIDSIVGVGAPEPLAHMYSHNFYRVTWIVTGLDAGFATAMNIQPKWLRDLASVLFSVYYIIFAQEADEKLRKFRAFCTVEMMRATWHKTSNPYIRAFTFMHRPGLPIARMILLPRPKLGPHNKRPTRAWLFYHKSEKDLMQEEELLLDLCGGGFVCMSPEHHEERLRQLAREMKRPVLAIDYCKAPEFPFPYALEECFDVYRSIIDSNGRIIGMGGNSTPLRIILSGDSAGGNLAAGVMLKIIEYPQPHIKAAHTTEYAHTGKPAPRLEPLPKPLAMLLAYPSLNFSYGSWLKPEHLRVLRVQSEANLRSIQDIDSSSSKPIKQDPKATSPNRVSASRSRSRNRRASLSSPIGKPRPDNGPLSPLALRAPMDTAVKSPTETKHRPLDRSQNRSYTSLANQAQMHLLERARFAEAEPMSDDPGQVAPYQDDSGDEMEDSPLANVVSRAGSHGASTGNAWLGRIEGDDVDVPTAPVVEEPEQDEQAAAQRELAAAREAADAASAARSSRRAGKVRTRLTMTSMAGYFQDRILTQSMMRAMAILYIGGRRQPDFENDYLLSPLVAPARLLAEFPPVLFICGEKDPICDDTVVMAGRIREAKLAKKADISRRRAGASARFGESLRLSSAAGAAIPSDPIENEDSDDWIQMRIIEGWSHGFLQMSSLLPEAKQVISFLAAWVSETFEEHNEQVQEARERAAEPKRPAQPRAIEPSSSGSFKSSSSSGASGAKPYVVSQSSPLGRISPKATTATVPDVADSQPVGSDNEEEEEEAPITFTTKRRQPSHGSPRLSPSSPNASITPSSSPLSSHSALQAKSPAVAALQEQSRMRPRPSSFSNGEARSRQSGIAEGDEGVSVLEDELPDSPNRSRRRRSLDGASPSRLRASESKTDGYRNLLVRESNLLQRRREDAVFALAGPSGNSAVQSDEEDDEHEHEGEQDIVVHNAVDEGPLMTPAPGAEGVRGRRM